MDRQGMGGPPQGGPPQGGPMGLSNEMERSRSIMNPRDAAYMKKSGQIDKDMTVADFVQNVLKTPLDAPVGVLIQNLGKLKQNADPRGKMANIAAESGGPRGVPENPMPQGRKPAVSGIDGLMQQMGG